VAVFRLPVYSVAGAALMGTFITSIAGVFFYSMIPARRGWLRPGLASRGLFGFGGFFGMYIGARPAKNMFRRKLSSSCWDYHNLVAIRYVLQYFS